MIACYVMSANVYLVLLTVKTGGIKTMQTWLHHDCDSNASERTCPTSEKLLTCSWPAGWLIWGSSCRWRLAGALADMVMLCGTVGFALFADICIEHCTCSRPLVLSLLLAWFLSGNSRQSSAHCSARHIKLLSNALRT